jgi:hypothetical protein
LQGAATARALQRAHVHRLVYWVRNNPLPCPATKDAHHDVQPAPGDTKACIHCGLRQTHCLEEWP